MLIFLGLYLIWERFVCFYVLIFCLKDNTLIILTCRLLCVLIIFIKHYWKKMFISLQASENFPPVPSSMLPLCISLFFHSKSQNSPHRASWFAYFYRPVIKHHGVDDTTLIYDYNTLSLNLSLLSYAIFLFVLSFSYYRKWLTSPVRKLSTNSKLTDRIEKTASTSDEHKKVRWRNIIIS